MDNPLLLALLCVLATTTTTASTTVPIASTTLHQITTTTTAKPVMSSSSLEKADFLGCFLEKHNYPDFYIVAYVADDSDDDPNSYLNCRAKCALFPYFALNSGNECRCGRSYGKYGPATNCNVTCFGAPNTTCGGVYANQVYMGLSKGCFGDSVHQRDLPNLQFNANFRAHKDVYGQCASHCLQYKYFGLQNGTDCWCGDSPGKYGQVSDAACNVTCPDNKYLKTCGGAVANQIFRSNYIGCFADQPKDRDLSTRGVVSVNNGNKDENSYSLCFLACSESGFDFFGLQNGTNCWCGNSFGRYGTSDGCNVTCPADSSGWGPGTCGGVNANQIYTIWG